MKKPSSSSCMLLRIVFLSLSLLACNQCQVLSFSSNLLERSRPSCLLRMNREPPYQDGMQQGDYFSYKFWEEPMTTEIFNMDLHNIAMEDARKAQDALEIMEELYEKEQEADSRNKSMPSVYVRPNAASYTVVIEGWVSSGDKDASRNAQSLLDKIEKAYDETGDEWIKPNVVSYMLVCQTWADNYRNRKTGVSAKQAHGILKRMKERGLSPSVHMYTKVLTAWTRISGSIRGAMEQAEKILTEMETLANVTNATKNESSTVDGVSPEPSQSRSDSSNSVRPNVITYTEVIGGYARSKERDLATTAESFLERMERHGVQADVVAYTSVLNAWSKTTTYGERLIGAKRSLALVDRMEKMYAQDNYHLKPNSITYAACISAIGNSFDPDAPDLAEGLLRRMYELHENQKITGVKPTTETFNALITALARSSRGNGRKKAQTAESLLVEMTKRSKEGELDCQPNVRTWSGVMSAWASSGENAAAINAQRVLDNLVQLHEIGQTSVRPNCVCYTAVMGAWSTSRRPDSADRAEQLLWRMEKQFSETGDRDARPNAITYVTLMNGFVKNNAADAGKRSQKIVDRMMRLYLQNKGFNKPSRMVFNALINAWSKSGDESSPRHAERIFQWMEQQSKDGDGYFKPDDVTFCAVLDAWANHATNGGAHRAQQLLDHMEGLTTQERGFEQSIICYNIVIKAWARSQDPEAVHRAEKILERLENSVDGLRPDTTTYSSAINCCAYYRGPPEGREGAFDFAISTFNKLCQSKTEGPNHVTYGTLIKAVTNLTPLDNARGKVLESIFQRCCADGQADTFVLTQLKQGCTAQHYRKLLGGAPPSRNVKEEVKRLPPKWTLNVPRRKY